MNETEPNGEMYVVQLKTLMPERVVNLLGEACLQGFSDLEIYKLKPESLADYVHKSPEAIKYNPELVSYTWDYESESIVSIITDDKLISFALTHNLASKKLCNHLINALYHDAQKSHLERTFSPMYHYPSSAKVALRADLLPELNRRIEDGDIFIYRAGAKSKQLLNEIERALILVNP